MKKNPVGRPLDLDQDIKVIKYRLKGYSFRKISEVLDEDLKCIYRRYKRTLAKLSTHNKE